MRPPHLVVSLLVVVALSLPGAVAADGTVIDHSGEGLTLDAADDEHIHGTTSFSSGTLIGVRVKSVGDTHPFLVSKAVRVGENGTFDVTFDLSELSQLRGGPVQVSIRHNQQSIYQENATLVTHNMPGDSTLTPDVETTATTTETAPPSTATTTDSRSGFEVPGFGVGAGVAALCLASFAAYARF
ncbi:MULTISPECIES: BGTF surface domain-containing protein [Haloferax]|uniref:Secreted glycoprotein n=2 Tax=Haloferax gibbonsii TaxID=35746 RepID=A0A0K1IRL5_HALGI|nr:MULTISPECIES: BGTF surface domain-containing protein [Haloferax]AKU07192.1 hypothetical protein ABY42_05335 [Haloferax gibbonsii]ELZ76545.1 hypothetical protein C454_17288 [Haloferax gibbonsii ATCC 33959]QOS11263.1 putative secreted glycoprotein [Haloferax gibbonsii]RDZ55050.1 hypothetical protein C5C07_05905 [Haloferax sp. Atlit-4N]